MWVGVTRHPAGLIFLLHTQTSNIFPTPIGIWQGRDTRRFLVQIQDPQPNTIQGGEKIPNETPEKLPEAEAQLRNLDSALDGLFESVTTIQERLSSVLKPKDETKCLEKGPTNLTPLASRLLAMTDRILVEKMRLIAMVECIEL